MDRPICCNRIMYPCGGTIGGEKPEQYWRCDICKQEVHDVYIEIIEDI